MTGGGRLLLVEDHVFLAEATAEFLRLSGFDVSIAVNGEDALEAVRTFRPDIVLCDLSLPDMSGLDLLRMLRSNSDAKEAVLAVLTAMDKVDLRLIECQTDVQVDLCFSKPLTEQQLRRLLNELGSRRQAARSPVRADKSRGDQTKLSNNSI
jgi:DNA-binding response OmpR family regulator